MPNNNRRNRASNPTTSRAVTRNFVAKNQWQRGGVHEKTTKAKRKNAKQALQNKIRAGRFLSQADSDSFIGLVIFFRMRTTIPAGTQQLRLRDFCM